VNPRQILLAGGFVCALAAMMAAWGQRTLDRAQLEARQAEAWLERVLRVESSLAASPPQPAPGEDTDPASAARSACLAAGINPAALASVQPRGIRQARGDRPAAATVEVVLREVAPDQWAHWLNAFTAVAGEWQPVHLHAQHSAGGSDPQAYDLHLTCERPVWTE
jgi:hypothetical protein